MTSEPLAPGVTEPSACVLAILHELLAKLRDLAASGRTGNIDLRRLPLTATDREQLRSLLGQGEVTAQIDALGPSKISEARLSGAWWVTHKNAAGETVGEAIEVALVPKIVAANPSDVRAAAEALAAQLAELGSPPP